MRKNAFAALLAAGLAMPALANDNAALLVELKRLAARVEALEKQNREMEQALQTDRLSEKEPELVTRLKTTEYRVEDMQAAAKAIEAIGGFSAGASFTTVGQRAKGGADTGTLANYRADITVTTPTLSVGNIDSKLFGHFRIGQGLGVADKLTTFVGPNASSFQLGTVLPPDSSAVMLAQAWYQADIYLPTDSPRQLSREKLTINFGKMDPFGFFDQNAAANDETRQFLASAFVHNALLDNPLAANVGVDGFGFSPGLRVAYHNERAKPESYGLSFGVFGSGKGADFSEPIRAPFVIVQAETKQRFYGLEGNYRAFVWRNGQAPTFVPEETARHAGLGLNFDQTVGGGVTLFGRYGAARGDDLPFDRTVSLGAQIGGSLWNRAADTVGIAFGAHRTSADFRARSAGVLDADGNPVYGFAASGMEKQAEVYYRYQVHPRFEISPDIQWIRNPAGNRDAKPVTIVGARVQLSY